MKLKTIDQSANWNEYLRTLPAPHVLQSRAWGDFKADHGWAIARLLWTEEGQPRAAAQILVQERGRVRLGYIPKGPVLDWSDSALLSRVFDDLERYAREHALLLLKIDPDVPVETEAGQALLEMLHARKWRSSFEQIQFRNTMLLDLRPDLDTILANMKSKWRYNVRLAKRRGVVVREVGIPALPQLYELYAETAFRDNFIIRTEDYYLDLWRRFLEAGLAVPLLAEVEETPVAMLILFLFDRQAWYMYGASSDLHRNCMPNHRLQWEAIKRAKERGCTTYDLWGAPDELDESDPMWGVYRFKEGFGAEFVAHVGAYDYAPNAFLYKVYSIGRPALVALAQHRYWARVNKNES